MNYLISFFGLLVLTSCSGTNLSTLSHSHPDGRTTVNIDGQERSVAHFPNKTLIGDKCYSMTNGNDPKSKPVIVTEDTYNDNCAGG